MKKRFSMIALVLVCIFAFAACSAPAADADAADEPAAEEVADEPAAEDADAADEPAADDADAADEPAGEGDLLIGYNNFFKGAYSLDILERAFTNTAEALGVDTMIVNDEAKVESAASNIDNMISAGVDGIVFFGVADTLFPVLAQKCETAGVPFVVYDHMPSDETLEILNDTDMYVGGACTVDRSTGENIAEFANEQNLKKAVIITGENTDTTHTARTDGFTEDFEAAGSEVVDVSYGEVGKLSDILPRSDDLLTANPDIDCIYATNGDTGIAAMEVLAKHPEVEAELFVTDLDPEVLEGMRDGKIAAANGAHWVNPNFATALLVNHLRGNTITDADGNAPMIEVPVITMPGNMLDVYEQYWIETLPFSAEEMQAFVSADMTLADFEQAMADYTIVNRLEAKVAEGLMTQEELDDLLAGAGTDDAADSADEAEETDSAEDTDSADEAAEEE